MCLGHSSVFLYARRCLKPGGKVGIITWKHSECAIVIDYFRSHEVRNNEWFQSPSSNTERHRTREITTLPGQVSMPEHPLLQWYRKAHQAAKTGDFSHMPKYAKTVKTTGTKVSRRRWRKLEDRLKRPLPRQWGYEMEDVSRWHELITWYRGDWSGRLIFFALHGIIFWTNIHTTCQTNAGRNQG